VLCCAIGETPAVAPFFLTELTELHGRNTGLDCPIRFSQIVTFLTSCKETWEVNNLAGSHRKDMLQGFHATALSNGEVFQKTSSQIHPAKWICNTTISLIHPTKRFFRRQFDHVNQQSDFSGDNLIKSPYIEAM
jgi:hypothetical protein